MNTPPASYSLDIVMPCFNEREALPVTVPLVLALFDRLVDAPDNRLGSFRLLLIDDGSADETWSIISSLAAVGPHVEGIRLSRNYGHQAAMMAGLTAATADAFLTMDADLQDDVNAIPAMLAAFETGAHLALGVRCDRSSDSFAKRTVADGYYRMLAALGAPIIHNHADFRLMSRQALAALLEHREANLFLRGLIPTLGFPVMLIPYKRQKRLQGEPQYTLRRMLRLALDGITSFSVAPLRLIAIVGAAVFLSTTIAAIVLLWLRFNGSDDLVPGWTSTLLPILFLGGIQLLSTGILGEYVGKIYLETKRRPRFIVQESTAEHTASPLDQR